jgi:hypothetical protein
MWITKKKNLITQNAKYENIVYLHDYIIFDENWYEGFLKFGDDFHVCMTKIINTDGSRFRDWTLSPFEDNFIRPVFGNELLLPYDVTNFSKYMYISGSYWVAKKIIMEIFPLDETRGWFQGEDIVWSRAVKEHFNFSMNTFSSVTLLKYKDPIFSETPERLLQILRDAN